MLLKEWFTARELAELSLPGVRCTESGVARQAKELGWADQTEKCRRRAGRGGGVEYHYSQLPHAALSEVAFRFRAPVEAPAQVKAADIPVCLTAYNKATAKQKRLAEAKLNAIVDYETLVKDGNSKIQAVAAVCAKYGIAQSTLYEWLSKTAGVSRHNRLAALVRPRGGRPDPAYIPRPAWERYLALYLTPSQSPHSACFRHVKAQAQQPENLWKLPAAKTFVRRVERDVPEAVRVLCRKGVEAARELYPCQTRERSHFRALECVNADGHKWDVMVRWPDGTVGRPMMVAFQDLYSNMILSWRVGQSESRDLVRLAFGDLVENFGIPEQCWLDNGRGFASKWLTGGVQHRYRFDILDDDPIGIMPLLDVKVHWTKPYSGQSKPIERAFGEFASNYAKHPKFEGAGTGNSPMTKPADYGSAVVPLDVFLDVATSCILEHNSREGRNTTVCGGKLSFLQAFKASYERSDNLIKKASESHRQLWLLAAEGVTARQHDGCLHIMKNRYWAEELLEYRGKKLVVRFDPQRLAEGVHAYTPDGRLICHAKVQGAVAFDDAGAARAHANAMKSFEKGLKKQAEALRAMTAAAAAAPLHLTPPPLPEARLLHVVMPNGALRVAASRVSPDEAIAEDGFSETDRKLLRATAKLRLVREEAAEV
jgi:transposase InsO family protein